MTLMEEILSVIEKDKDEKENRYCHLEYFALSKMIVIRPIYTMSCDQAIFMGEALEKLPTRDIIGRRVQHFNSYLLILKQKYPITVEFTSNECRIKYDNSRMRKWKIKNLLSQ